MLNKEFKPGYNCICINADKLVDQNLNSEKAEAVKGLVYLYGVAA